MREKGKYGILWEKGESMGYYEGKGKVRDMGYD